MFRSNSGESTNVVGKTMKRVDAFEKVNGSARFAADIAFDGQIYCALVIAEKPHGILRSIDTVLASEIEGVEGIFTWRDIPGENQLGEAIKDMPCLVKEGEKIRF